MARPKPAKQLGRRRPTREPYDRVLIACEDELATPRYLEGLIRDLGIASANIKIAPHGGSAPRSVVQAAISAFESDPDFDQVYCVFDKDAHATYNEALDKVRNRTLKRRGTSPRAKAVVFEAMQSVPCFEFWLLLHFTRTTAPMPRFADVLPLLRSKPGFGDYDKGSTDTFKLTRSLLDTAIANAKFVNAEAGSASTDNPTTRMGDLAERLRAVRDG